MNAKRYRTLLVCSARFGMRKKECKDDAVPSLI